MKKKNKKQNKKTSIKQNTNTIASPTNSKWNTNPSKKKFKIKHVQHAHIQKKKKKCNSIPIHLVTIDQPAKRNHQIDFEFFTTFLVLLTKILSYLRSLNLSMIKSQRIHKINQKSQRPTKQSWQQT